MIRCVSRVENQNRGGFSGVFRVSRNPIFGVGSTPED